MAKKIEQGCMAIVVDGECTSNIGKVITVGSYIGKVAGNVPADWWNCDQLMDTTIGDTMFMQREDYMERIDAEDVNEQIETAKSITA